MYFGNIWFLQNINNVNQNHVTDVSVSNNANCLSAFEQDTVSPIYLQLLWLMVYYALSGQINCGLNLAYWVKTT